MKWWMLQEVQWRPTIGLPGLVNVLHNELERSTMLNGNIHYKWVIFNSYVTVITIAWDSSISAPISGISSLAENPPGFFGSLAKLNSKRGTPQTWSCHFFVGLVEVEKRYLRLRYLSSLIFILLFPWEVGMVQYPFAMPVLVGGRWASNSQGRRKVPSQRTWLFWEREQKSTEVTCKCPKSSFLSHRFWCRQY